MKQFLLRIFAIIGRIGAALAACSGCNGPNPPDRPPDPKIHWKGVDSGYQDETAAQPNTTTNPAPRK